MDTRENRVFAQFQKVCQNVWLSSKSMPVYITLKKCSTQYVAHFMWLTKSLKIGEYATICSTLYVLPFSSQEHSQSQQILAMDFFHINILGNDLFSGVVNIQEVKRMAVENQNKSARNSTRAPKKQNT